MNRRAFTLIELLVVISVIGLLSSVVFSSLNTAREKARIAGARQFVAQTEHVSGDYAVGIWDFDECSGSSVKDRSGNGNTGTLNGTGLPSWLGDTPDGKGCSLSFNGANSQYVNAGSAPSLDITSTVTLVAWVKLSSYASGGSNTDRQGVIIKPGNYYMTVNSTTGTLDIYLYGALPVHTPSLSAIPLNKWTMVAVSYDGSAVKWFIDGKLDKSIAVSGAMAIDPRPLQFGGETGFGRFINGQIAYPRVFAKGLMASEIGAMYAADSNRYVARD